MGYEKQVAFSPLTTAEDRKKCNNKDSKKKDTSKVTSSFAKAVEKVCDKSLRAGENEAKDADKIAKSREEKTKSKNILSETNPNFTTVFF